MAHLGRRGRAGREPLPPILRRRHPQPAQGQQACERIESPGGSIASIALAPFPEGAVVQVEEPIGDVKAEHRLDQGYQRTGLCGLRARTHRRARSVASCGVWDIGS
jgi:hypothetical protein